MQGHGVRLFHDPSDLIAGVAARRGVELIGLVDELDDPGMIDCGERPADGGHGEPAEEVVHAFRRSEQCLALALAA